MDLDRILTLRRADEWPLATSSEPIPLVLGNWLDPSAVPQDDLNAGFTPARCIDQFNLVYAYNATSAVSTQPLVYFNGVWQPFTTYTWNPSDAYQGRDPVATLQFNVNTVLQGEVSVRHGGTVDGQGMPLTNPIRTLIWLFTTYGGWTFTDFDRALCDRTALDIDALGYGSFMWVFQEEKTLRDWLLEILPHYHTDVTETGRNQLAMILDRSVTTLPVTADYHVSAADIQDFGSPPTAISSEKQLDDLANQVTLHCRHQWVASEPTHTVVADFVQSQAAYQAAYPIEFSFRGMYTLSHMTQWLNSFFTRHGFEPRVVRFTLRGLKGIPLIPPRLITVEWPPLGWQRRLLKVRKRTSSWSRQEVTLECVDCQREVTDSVDAASASLVERRQQLSRVYQWIPGTIGDHGLLEDGPGPSKNEAANGDFELGDTGQWNVTAGTGPARWTIVNDAAEAYQGRWYAKSVVGQPDYNIVTLRRRIDPGEWLLVNGWFRIHAAGANGNARVIGVFYDVDGDFLQLILGNPINPTETYTESLLFAQAPAGSYWFRPGIGILPVLTTGQWRADRIVANSGSRGELLAKRLNDLATPNLVINGDFEAGDIGWTKDTGWVFDSASPRSGSFHMTHVLEAAANQVRYLTPATFIPVSPGQPFRVQAYWTSNFGNGEAHMGVFWLDGLGFVNSFDNSAALGPPGGTYTYHAWAGTVPTQAVYALPYAQMFNHTQGVWTLDDFAVGFSL